MPIVDTMHGSHAPGGVAGRLPLSLNLRFGKTQDMFETEDRDVFYSDRMNHAQAFAAKVHRKQYRKGTGIPYMSHLWGVASNVLKFSEIAKGEHYLEKNVHLSNGETVDITLEDAVIAALLHDAIEDQGGSAMKRKIKEKFDEAGFPAVVTMLVDYCTTYGEDGLSYNAYKRNYLKRVAAPETPKTVLLISGSDKLDNMRDMLREYREAGETFWERFKVSKEEKLEYNRDIVSIFRASGKYPRLVDEIERVQKQIERLAKSHRGPVARLFYQLVIRPWEVVTGWFRRMWRS